MPTSLTVERVRQTKARADLVAMARGLGVTVQDHYSNSKIRKILIQQVSDGPKDHGKQHQSMLRVRRSESEERTAGAQVAGNTRGSR